VAWDLLGFTSFFLVIFFRSRASLGGGLLTALSNRIGDVCLLAFFGGSTLSSSNGLSWYWYLLLLVSFTKSAQVPFSSWLPAAMLAPTPVSALVHSSTLVTAGVYLLYRYSFAGHNLLLYVGVFSTLAAGLSALNENDAKKIIAYSTISQLGLIFSSLGLGERAACFAHLNTHATFKALTFLVIGTVIHSVFGSQEARATGLIPSLSPFLYVVLAGALSSMCGLVFLSGWVTKEAILEARLSSSTSFATVFLFYVGIGVTILYCMRLIILLASPEGHFLLHSCSARAPRVVALPLLFLFSLSVLQGGFLFGGLVHLPPVFHFCDGLLIWGVWCIALLSFCLLREGVGVPSGPSAWLGAATLLLASWSAPGSKLHQTEVSAFHGGGLAISASMVGSSLPGKYLWPKAFCLLFLVALLI